MSQIGVEKKERKLEESSVMEKEKEEEENRHDHENNNTLSNDCKVVSEDFTMDQSEKIKVDEMRSLCQKLDPSSDDQELEDDIMLRRFLRARDMDVNKASNMFLKYLKWRRSAVPGGSSVLESQVKNEIAQNKFFMQGLDKKGRPIAVLLAARHKQAKLDEFKNFAVYSLDKICSRMPKGHEKFVAIGDLQGWGYCNCDTRGYLAALSLLQDYYPERIAKVYIVHAPYIFLAFWKLIYPFIDKNTKKKIVFVDNEDLKSTLLSEIEESQLPIEYGGKLELVPIQDC